MKIVLNPDDSINEALKLYSCYLNLEIYLKNGIYKEKVIINKDNVKIIGESKEYCIIDYDDYNYKFHDDGLFYNTFRTSTLNVLGDYCELKNLTVINSSGSGKLIGPAISISIYGNYFKTNNCTFKGYQDTLFIGPLPNDLTNRYAHILSIDELNKKDVVCLFNKCTVIGNTDFLFGNGTCLLNECEIIIIGNKSGYICAPSTPLKNNYGFIFNKCRINNISSCAVWLARPWRENGSCIYYNCEFNGDIKKERYDNWGKTLMRFHEIPYVYSKFSSELNTFKIAELNQYIKTIFKVFK